MFDFFLKIKNTAIGGVIGFLRYLFQRLDEFSSWVAIALLVLAIIFLPKGLVLFIICALSMLLLIAPDTKFSRVLTIFWK